MSANRLTIATCLFVSLCVLGGTRGAEAGETTMGRRMVHEMFVLDHLELGANGTDNPLMWDAMAMVGGDWNRLQLEVEGETPTDERMVEGEAQLLYKRLIGPNWEFLLGARGDLVAAPGGRTGRVHAVVGFEGLAPYWFEMEPKLFVSDDGDVSARLTVSRDLFITQRLIVQPFFETNLAVQAVPEFGVGSGLDDIELALRLRYEIKREFAPYLGVSWHQLLFETADFAEAAGASTTNVSGLVGVRMWY